MLLETDLNYTSRPARKCYLLENQSVALLKPYQCATERQNMRQNIDVISYSFIRQAYLTKAALLLASYYS